MLAPFGRFSSKTLFCLPEILLVAATFLLSFTATNAADRDAQKLYRQVEAECLSEDRLVQLQCASTPVSTLPEAIRENYDRRGMRESLLDPLKLGSVTQPSRSDDISFVERIRRFNSANSDCVPAPEVAPEARICRAESTNGEEFDLFVRLLKVGVARTEAKVPPAARPFFRAYVAKCATSVSMSYLERESQSLREFLDSRFATSVEDLWARGEGECSEYAAVMTELGRSLSVPTWNVTTLFHEFNAVRIGEETLYLDAANPSCQFFIPK